MDYRVYDWSKEQPEGETIAAGLADPAPDFMAHALDDLGPAYVFATHLAVSIALDVQRGQNKERRPLLVGVAQTGGTFQTNVVPVKRRRAGQRPRLRVV